jgi:D-alanine-D-alanine ligase
VSLKTGARVLEHLPQSYAPLDIFISRDGAWHFGGMVRPPEKILSQVDVIFNALHGAYGEDGKVQALLERFGVPFTGSRSFPSSLSMHKGLSKKIFEQHGIKTPVSVVIKPKDATARRVVELFQSFPQPAIIKPVSGGSSVGITIAKDFRSFEQGIEEAFRRSGGAILEEYIRGQEASCAVVGNASGGLYSLLPVEIISPSEKDFFDYESKYELDSEHAIPGNFPSDIKNSIQHIALDAHNALGLRHYSQSDFIITPNRGIYLLEVNSLPGLTHKSLLPKSLSALGVSFADFLDHTLTLALTS